MVKILDISKHQGNMNFTKAKASGIEGVMLRFAYGDSKDTKFEEFYKKALSEGLSVGGYFFATFHYASLSPNFEAAKKNALSQTKKAISYLSGKKITAPVAVDIELESGAELKFSPEQLTELVNISVSEIKKAGFKPLVYSSVSWFFDRLDYEKITCPLWVAYYYKNAQKDSFPETRYGLLLSQLKGRMALWQFSSKGNGKTYGAGSEYVDENFCYDEKLFGIGEKTVTPTVKEPESKSLYTVKIKAGSWYVRKLYSTTSQPLKVISGSVGLQASNKKNGWFYLPAHKGWIGPAAVESSVYNNSKTKSYTVKSGDTLTKIARKFSSTVEKILSKNKKKYPKITRDYIQVGWVLEI